MANIFCVLFGHKLEECSVTYYCTPKPRRRKSIFNRKGGSKRIQLSNGRYVKQKKFYRCSRCGKI